MLKGKDEMNNGIIVLCDVVKYLRGAPERRTVIGRGLMGVVVCAY